MNISLIDSMVADLDAGCFADAATIIASALGEGGGGRIVFEPGDATVYVIEIGSRVSDVVPSRPDRSVSVIAVPSTTVGFGTSSSMRWCPWGHASRMDIADGWTRAVWQRLYTATTDALADREAQG